MAELDTRRAEVLGIAARIIQRRCRTYIAQREFISLCNASNQLQTCCRGMLAGKLCENLRQDATALMLQKNYRFSVTRKSYLIMRQSAITLQTGFRAMTSHSEFKFRKQAKAAIVIQSHARCHMAFSYYKKKTALLTQCGWRRRLAMRELRKLKMDARETGALKEVKNKLEKRVEELTWRVQLEKQLRVDCGHLILKTNLEEEKTREIAKLQEAFQAMQMQVEEANDRVFNEREATRKAIEEAPPVVKEVPVMVEDTAKIELLMTEVDSLKDLLLTEKGIAEDLKKIVSEAEARNAELMKTLEVREHEISQLKEDVQRMEEKLFNVESENQVLRQQAMTMAPTKLVPTRSKTLILQRTAESGTVSNEEGKPSSVDTARSAITEDTPQRYLNEKKQVITIDLSEQNITFIVGSGRPC